MNSLNVVKAASAVSIATMISRVLGVVREQVLAAYFDRAATDAYFTAFRIPNLLRDLFAEGALSAAFVPTFTDYRRRNQEEAWRLANLVINALLAVLSVATLIFCLGAKPLVLLLAPGFQSIPGKVELATKMTQIMSPFLLFVAVAAAIMGVLNTGGRFFVSAMAPAMFNITNILAGILLSPWMPRFGQEPIVAMAIGSLAGSIGQMVIQWPQAYRMGFRHRWTLNWHDPGLQRIGRLMIPAIFGLAATQINVIIDNQFSSRYGNGPVSWLNYAFRLMQLPIGIFGVAIATANLAAVARDAANQNLENLKFTLAKSLRYCILLTIPATAGLIALRGPIVRVIYEHGVFTAEHTQYTANALLFYSVGLFAYSSVKILVPTFYALNNSKIPVVASALSVVIKILLNFLFTAIFGFVGLALSTALAATLNMVFLSLFLRRCVGSMEGLGIISTLIRVTSLSTVMGVACHFTYRSLSPFASNSFAGVSWVLAICIGLGLVLTLLLGHLLKIKEIEELKLAIRRRYNLGG